MDLGGLEASLVHLMSSRAVGQPESGLLVKLHASILRKVYEIESPFPFSSSWLHFI